MQLIKIIAENFCCFERFDINLKKMGLVWVTGENSDTKSADNNGSGKSTIFKALTWGLYGQTIDGERGDGIIKDGAREAVVSILVKDGTSFRTIKRSRKKGVPILEIFEGDKGCVLPKKELQQKIDEMLGLDYIAFKNTVIYGQNDSSRFADPKTKDSDRKEVLHKILNIGILKVCHEEVRNRRLEAKTTLNKVENELSSCKAKLYEQNLNDLRQLMNDYEGDREHKIGKVKVALSEFKRELKTCAKTKNSSENTSNKIETAKKKISKLKSFEEQNKGELESKITKINEKIDSIRLEKNSKEVEIGATKGELRVINEQLSMLETTNCPVCRSPLNKGTAKQHVSELLSKQKYLKNKIKEIAESRNVLTDVNRRNYTEKEKLIEKSDSLNELKNKILDTEIIIKQLKLEEAEIKNEKLILAKKKDSLKAKISELNDRKNKLEDENNPYITLLKKAVKKTRMLKEQLKDIKKERNVQIKKLSQLEFWYHGFSNRGLPSFLLDGVMPILSDRTNYYLEILTDGDIKVEFSTQSEKKSNKGEYKDEIEISWEVEGVTGYPPSGGQLKKIGLATDLALMDLAISSGPKAPDLLVLDEILDGLDDKGVQRVLLLLQELRKKRDSIFVISHDERMSEIFERTVVVKKEKGNSILEVIG